MNKVRSQRCGFPQGIAHQFVDQCQTANLENIQIDTIIETQQAIFEDKFLCANTYVHIITIDGERGHKFEREWEGFGGRKGRDKHN